MANELISMGFAEEVVGFSFGSIVKSLNPVRVTKNLAKATLKAIDPRTHLAIAKAIISNPLNVKRNIGKLAMLDPGIRTSVKMFKDMKGGGKAKPKAVAAYKQAVVKASEGDPEAKKQVGAIKQLAIAEKQAPNVPDSEMERGAEEIVTQAKAANPQVFNQTFAQASSQDLAAQQVSQQARAQQESFSRYPIRQGPSPSDYEEEDDYGDDEDEDEYDDSTEGDEPKARHRGRKHKKPDKVSGEVLLGGFVEVGGASYADILRTEAAIYQPKRKAQKFPFMGAVSFSDLLTSASDIVNTANAADLPPTATVRRLSPAPVMRAQPVAQRAPMVQTSTDSFGNIIRASLTLDKRPTFLKAGNKNQTTLTISGDDELMGFDFGSIIKAATNAVKTVAPMALTVAKLTPYGAAIDTALKVAGPALNMGVNMLRGAQKGNPADVAKVNQVKALAASGSAQGKAALQTLQQAKVLNNAVVTQARAVVAQPSATVTMPSATPGGAPVQVYIMMPGTDAAKSVVQAAQQAGSKFFIPSTLYQQGFTAKQG